MKTLLGIAKYAHVHIIVFVQILYCVYLAEQYSLTATTAYMYHSACTRCSLLKGSIAHSLPAASAYFHINLLRRCINPRANWQGSQEKTFLNHLGSVIGCPDATSISPIRTTAFRIQKTDCPKKTKDTIPQQKTM